MIDFSLVHKFNLFRQNRIESFKGHNMKTITLLWVSTRITTGASISETT